jgi:predicted ATPase/DNA-binding CsgD family transcriptional regulator
MDTIPPPTEAPGTRAPSRLPIPLTSFVGRTDEMDLAQDLLRSPGRRLLTLTGPGGIGKTRLAIEIASRLADDYPDGVCFVSLAAVPHHSLVMPAIAGALGLRELDSDSAPAAVAATLGTARLLMVVDNLEHVLDAAPSLTRLLSQCPNVQMLATSRSLLRVEGEHAIPVPSLTLPPLAQELTEDDWLRVPVIQLFIERAQAVDPARTWASHEVTQLVDICGRLDGLPLAVELAATKVRHLTLPEIRQRLDERLPLLVDGSRDHPNRLRTMRNAIAWSYDLLPPAAQTLFRRLAVFAGGFTRNAVEEISAELDAGHPDESPAAHETASVHEHLSLLIDASLLLREIDDVGTPRYRMLETIREFASEQLTASGEAEAARGAHATCVIRFAEAYEFADLMPSADRAIERLDVERANLHVALTWLADVGDTKRLLRLVAAHGNFWSATANYHEARFWYERALTSSASDAGRADIARHRARILTLFGHIELLQGDLPASERRLTAGLEASRANGEPYYAALALLGLGAVAILQDDGERSAKLLHECRQVADDIPDRRLAELVRGMVSLNLGVVSRAAGDHELAAAQIGDMLRRARAEDYRHGILLALGDLGDLARDRGELDRALTYYKEALTLGRTQPIKRVLIEVIESVAIVAARTGQADRSACLLGATQGLRERTGLRYRQPESSSSLSLANESVRAALGEPAFAAARELGRGLSADRAIGAALDVQPSVPSSSSSQLTPRETEIARLLVSGMTDPEIAAALFISVRTVENHVAHILAKLGANNRTAAASALLK